MRQTIRKIGINNDIFLLHQYIDKRGRKMQLSLQADTTCKSHIT